MRTATIVARGAVTRLRLGVLVTGAVVATLCWPAASAGATPGAWSTAGNMAQFRAHADLTLLPSGKVLATGGLVSLPGPGGYFAPATAELFDPAIGTWSAAGSMSTGRAFGSSTLLPNGKVLVAGGNNTVSYVKTGELYDETTGTWSPAGTMADAHYTGTATLLPDGKVLIAGGYSDAGLSTGAELYDPTTGFTSTGSMTAARGGGVATLLPNGTVLVVGGYGAAGPLSSAEVYDPTTETWSATASMSAARTRPTATLLSNGKVLVAGGSDQAGALASAELYDPATGAWTATGAMSTTRFNFTATRLLDGRVLAVGGWGPTVPLATTELYDPATGTWTASGSLATARNDHGAVRLADGAVLVATGADAYPYGIPIPLVSSEVYDPPAPTGPVDTDGDGIADDIDPDPTQSSTSFSDAITGHPATSGVVTSVPAGLAVHIEDADDPLGVRIQVTGAGTGQVSLTVCGLFTLQLAAGSDVVVTCGSVTVTVTQGSATIVLSDDTTVTIPEGASAKVSAGTGGTFVLSDIENGPVTVTTEGVPRQVSVGGTIAAWDFVGFSAPVDNGGVLNQLKAGRAVPLKWRMVDEAGAPVTTITSASVRVETLPCSLGTTVDQIEETVPGASGLKNLGNGYYQLNWQTPSSYAGSCKTMRLDLGEGLTRDALFQFTR